MGIALIERRGERRRAPRSACQLDQLAGPSQLTQACLPLSPALRLPSRRLSSVPVAPLPAPVQAAPAFPDTFPHMFGERKDIRCGGGGGGRGVEAEWLPLSS